jgi:4-amino-4-deoxy-L-arabinose transferase-like glycosyltransferase
MIDDKKSTCGEPSRTKLIALLIVIAVSGLTAFWALGSRAIGNHEAYVGVTARNMVASGNWLIPVLNGENRLNKTPLSYWLVAAASKAAGSINNFIVRLPSAILAVLSAIAIFYFVSAWLGFRTGALSALIWSTSFCYVNYSHTGRPEMALAVFTTIAMLSFYSAIEARSRAKQIYCMLVFWLSFSLAMLAKGPAPIPLIFPALFFYFLIFSKWKLFPKLLPITGLILFLLIFLPWPIMILLKCPHVTAVWKDEFLGRAAGEYASSSKPYYYYFKIIFALFLPFSAFIPLALTAPFYRIWDEKRPVMFYLWLWFVAGLVVMSVFGSRRPHYILPIIPAMAVLTGIILNDMIFEQKAYSRKFSTGFLLINLIGFFAVATGMVIWLLKTNYPSKWVIIYALLFVIADLLIAAGLFKQNKKPASAVCLQIGLCAFIIFSPFTNNAEDEEAIADFALQVKNVAADVPVIAYCKINASFIYYFGKDVPMECNIDRIYAQYSDGKGIIATAEYFEQLIKDGRFSPVVKDPGNSRGFFLKNK